MSAAHLKQAPTPDGEAPRSEFKPGCSGKAKHTRQEATAILLRRRAGQAYPCRTCGAWHTSSVPVNVPRRKDPVG